LILIIQIVSRAKEAGLKLSPNQLFDRRRSPSWLTRAEVALPAAPLVMEQEAIEGPAPLESRCKRGSSTNASPTRITSINRCASRSRPAA
jgi:hypothetical protein